ncbi:MAG: hypothetical protein ACI88C_000063 [Acidimicrobiales bacterium]|jgi:hypothetical protein
MTLQDSVAVPTLATLATFNSSFGHIQNISPFSEAVLLRRYLDTVGNGTGTKNIVTGNTAGDEFFIAPPADTVYVITALDVYIAGSTSVTFDDEWLYGDQTALSAGLQLKVEEDSAYGTEIVDLFDGLTVKKNRDWLRAGAYQVENNFASMTAIQLRLDLAAKYAVVHLRGNDLSRLVLTVQGGDLLSGLDEHYVMAHGFQLDVA